MRRTISTFGLAAAVLPVLAFVANGPVERWAAAVGGRERVAAVTSIYREGSLEYGGYRGTIRVWHTADGKYRKEERIAAYSTIETFDGMTGMVKENDAAPRRMTEAESTLATSRRFANSNAMLFAFFPERRHGTVTVVDDNTVVLRPEGGVPWRVSLDPRTALPAAMMHHEGDQTITVTYAAYETIDGITFESEIRRSAGDPSRGAVIRFTKTVLNQPLDASLFTLES